MVILNVPISTFISHDINKIKKDTIKNNNGARLLSTTLVRKFLRLTPFCPNTKIKYKINKTEWTQTKLQLQLLVEVGWLCLLLCCINFAPLSVKKTRCRVFCFLLCMLLKPILR